MELRNNTNSNEKVFCLKKIVTCKLLIKMLRVVIYLIFANNYFQARIFSPANQLPAKTDLQNDTQFIEVSAAVVIHVFFTDMRLL